MLHAALITLTMFGGVLVESFPVAQAEPEHHQIMVRAAMAPDGRFAVAWIDSMFNPESTPNYADFELFIRFFEPDGTPLTEPQRIVKVADSNRLYWHHLDMDSAGNAVLLWAETTNEWGHDPHILFQLYDRDGTLKDTTLTVTTYANVMGINMPIGLDCNRKGEFAVTWIALDVGEWIWIKRFAADGTPQGDSFLVHDEFSEGYVTHFRFPQVALNDSGDLVVTWLKAFGSFENFPKYQVFDAQDVSVLPWEPEGHRVHYETDDGTRSEVHWLDDDRFVIFWAERSLDDNSEPLRGRVFSDRGLTPHPMRNLVSDFYWIDSLSTVKAQWGGRNGWFSTAVSPDEGFALTHTRSYVVINDSSFDAWYHQAGALGSVIDNTPVRLTSLFEYSPPYEEDTAGKDFNFNVQPPAVAVCDDRIVWVYTRYNPDTIFEAWVLITDWDMGEGVAESLVPRASDKWQVTSIGSEIVLRYSDYPDGFQARVFDPSGRVVDMVNSPNPSGTITWGDGFNPGVYFIRSITDKPSTSHKVVLVK